MAKPKSNPKRHRFDDRQTHRMSNLLDELKEFDEFKEKLLPAIRKDLTSGMSAEEIRKKYEAVVQARSIITAVTDKDSGKALAAAKDILDRSSGKATEKKEVTHKFSDLRDEELDAVLQSELQDLDELDSATEH